MFDVVKGKAELDGDRTTADGKASSVQFVHFEFEEKEIEGIKNNIENVQENTIENTINNQNNPNENSILENNNELNSKIGRAHV